VDPKNAIKVSGNLETSLIRSAASNKKPLPAYRNIKQKLESHGVDSMGNKNAGKSSKIPTTKSRVDGILVKMFSRLWKMQ
jgi:hypothetical protein